MIMLTTCCSAEGSKQAVVDVHVRVSSRFREASRWGWDGTIHAGQVNFGQGNVLEPETPGPDVPNTQPPASSADRAEAESQHRVRITAAYFLGMYEVTQSEYAKAPANPSPT
jgi:formylglycine-generating enzyme required for sulfatase activity